MKKGLLKTVLFFYFLYVCICANLKGKQIQRLTDE